MSCPVREGQLWCGRGEAAGDRIAIAEPSRFFAAVDRNPFGNVRELLPHRSPRRRPGPAGSHRTGNDRQEFMHATKKELPCKGEPRASGR